MKLQSKGSSKKSSSSSKKSSNKGGLFNRGYGAAREEKERQDQAREARGKRLYNLFLANDGDEAQVRFLTEEPLNFYAHNVRTVRGGRERFDTVVCTQDGNCPYCEDGDKPSYKAAFLVYDRRKFKVEDSKTGKKKTVNGQVRLYVQGVRIVSQLDRISSKYGLTKCDITIARVGSGQNTTYTFDRMPEENDKLTKAEISNLLPEKLRSDFDGSMDSLYDIVEQQLEYMMPQEIDREDDEDEDDEDTERERRRRKNLVSYDEEDEDDEDEEDEDESPRRRSKSRYVDEDEDDDEEEEERPRKKSKLSKKSDNKKKRPMFKR